MRTVLRIVLGCLTIYVADQLSNAAMATRQLAEVQSIIWIAIVVGMVLDLLLSAIKAFGRE